MGQFGSRDSGFFTNSQTTVNCQFITCCTINQCGVEVPDSGCCATVRCGANNCASGDYSATLGGRCNTSSSLYSAIVGGFCNIASGCNSFVGGGSCNTASGVCSFVGGGGQCNTASGIASTIVGGLGNLACGGSSFVGGGCTNCAIADGSSIVGGVGNRACCQYSTTVGGLSNTANGNSSFIGGGSCSTASGCYSAILGGQCNNICNFTCAMIVGANICATQACTTFVNNLSVCSFNSCSGCSVCIGANGVLLSTSNFGSLTLQQVTTNGNTSNVGISVTAGGVSTNTLNVTSLTTGSVPFVGAAGLITQDNANLFFDDTNNRLGIGTTSPAFTLDVNGAGRFTGALTGTSATFSGAVSAGGTGEFSINNGTNTYVPILTLTNNSSGANDYSWGKSVVNDLSLRNDNNNYFAITFQNQGTYANVGIGNIDPTALLHIGVISAAVNGTKGVKITNPAGTIVMLECGSSSDSFVGTTSGSDFHVRTNNTNRLSIASTGAATFSSSVTTGATSTLKATGNSFTDGSLILKNSNGTTNTYLTNAGGAFYLSNNGSTSVFEIASTGAATFSSSVTAQSLDVISSSGVGSSTASGLARFITAGATTAISIGQSTAARRMDIGNYYISVTGEQFELTTASSQPLIFNTNATEKMRITSGGNVGIGTTSPSGLGKALVVSNTSDYPEVIIERLSSGAGKYGMLVGNDGSFLLRNYNSGSNNLIIASTGAATFSSSVTAGAFIKSSVTSGSSVVTAESTATNGEGQLVVLGKNSSGTVRSGSFKYDNADLLRIGTSSAIDFRFETNDTERMRITSGGNVLIGSAVDDTVNKLQVDGRVNFTGFITSLGTYNNTTGTAANLQIDSNGFFARSTASSIRFKENVTNWENKGLETILKLRPVTFNYKKEYYNKADINFLGLIAEDVAEVLPYLADYKNENRTGQVENVRYANIVVPLISAIKEQQSIIESLIKRIELLENK